MGLGQSSELWHAEFGRGNTLPVHSPQNRRDLLSIQCFSSLQRLLAMQRDERAGRKRPAWPDCATHRGTVPAGPEGSALSGRLRAAQAAERPEHERGRKRCGERERQRDLLRLAGDEAAPRLHDVCEGVERGDGVHRAEFRI